MAKSCKHISVFFIIVFTVMNASIAQIPASVKTARLTISWQAKDKQHGQSGRMKECFNWDFSKVDAGRISMLKCKSDTAIIYNIVQTDSIKLEANGKWSKRYEVLLQSRKTDGDSPAAGEKLTILLAFDGKNKYAVTHDAAIYAANSATPSSTISSRYYN